MAAKKSVEKQPAKIGSKNALGAKRNLVAVDETISVLVAGGKIELEADSARVQAARNLAAAVDEAPGNANLWRQYREAVADLHVDDSISSSAEELARLLGSLSPKVGDQTET